MKERENIEYKLNQVTSQRKNLIEMLTKEMNKIKKQYQSYYNSNIITINSLLLSKIVSDCHVSHVLSKKKILLTKDEEDVKNENFYDIYNSNVALYLDQGKISFE